MPSGLTDDSDSVPLIRSAETRSRHCCVVVLLPPGNIKIRAFAPQGLLEKLRVGGGAEVRIDGAARPVPATIVFISPRAEFTPPVIYSQEMREKLVFRVDLAVAPELAAGLHPGQPVDVDFAPANQP